MISQKTKTMETITKSKVLYTAKTHTVGGRDPTGRAQTVTVEQAHRVATVGHDHAGRAVPRLHVH